MSLLIVCLVYVLLIPVIVVAQEVRGEPPGPCLVGCFRQRDSPLRDFRAPLGSGKYDNSVPYLAPTRVNGKRTDPLDDNGRALRIPFMKHLTFPGHLGQKDQAFVNLTFAVGEMADQEDSSFPVDFHFAVAETGISTLTGPASGSFGYLIYDFLWKGVEHNGTRSGDKLVFRVWPPVSTHDCVQGREIGQPRSILALGPDSYLVNQGPQLFL